MIFLAAVLGCAVTVGQWPAIAAAFLSFLAYNFFFIPPIYTFSIATPHELFALLIFLLVGVVTGGLAGRVRDQSKAARARAKTMQALYDISRKLSATVSIEDVLWVVVRQMAAAVKGQVVILLARKRGTGSRRPGNQGSVPARRHASAQRMGGRTVGLQPDRGGRLAHRHAAQCRLSVSSDPHLVRHDRHDRHLSFRPQQAPVCRRKNEPSRPSSIRAPWRSSGPCWSSRRGVARRSPSGNDCRRRCCPRSAMTCARRSPRSWDPPPACANTAAAWSSPTATTWS